MNKELKKNNKFIIIIKKVVFNCCRFFIKINPKLLPIGTFYIFTLLYKKEIAYTVKFISSIL